MDISGVDEEVLPRCTCADPLDKGMTHRTDGPCFTTPAEETAQQRIERLAAEPAVKATPEDVTFLLTMLRRAGDQRVAGLREAAGLIRAAKNREVTTRFLVGKKEQAARGVNSKLMDTIANLIDKYADDARDGRL